jgi:hypothetical protein
MGEGARETGEIDIVYAGRATPCINQVYIVVRSDVIVRRAVQALAAISRQRSPDNRLAESDPKVRIATCPLCST